MKQQNTRTKESSLHEAFFRNLDIEFREVGRVNGASHLNSVSKDDYREVCGEDFRRQWMECFAKIYGHKLWQFEIKSPRLMNWNVRPPAPFQLPIILKFSLLYFGYLASKPSKPPISPRGSQAPPSPPQQQVSSSSPPPNHQS